MNFSEFMFVLQFLMYMGIFLVTLYNIFSVGKFYDIKMVWTLFIAQIITYGIGFSIVLTLDTAYWAQTEIIGVLQQLQTFMFEGYFVMLVIQLFFYWKSDSTKPVSYHDSKKVRSEQERLAR